MLLNEESTELRLRGGGVKVDTSSASKGGRGSMV